MVDRQFYGIEEEDITKLIGHYLLVYCCVFQVVANLYCGELVVPLRLCKGTNMEKGICNRWGKIFELF